MKPELSPRTRRLVTTSALVVFSHVLSACGGAAARGSGGSEGVALDARLLAALDTRQQDTALIDSLLSRGGTASSSARRARAALAIGQLRIRDRYPVLRRLLLDADTAVAANAAFALGLARDSASIVQLGRAVAGAPDAVAVEAAWALGQIGEPARSVVAFALGDGTPQPLRTSTAASRNGSVRAELLMACVKIDSIPASVVTPWLADSSADAVRGAAYVIGRRRAAGGVRAMLNVRAHTDEVVRQHVARALARSATGDSLAARAREALRDLLADASPRVRANAARSIVTFGAVAREDIDRALRDPDANVRLAAMEGIQSIFASDGRAWRAAFDADTVFPARRQLLAGARRAGVNTLNDVEQQWRAHSDWRFRAAAVEAIAAGTPAAERRNALAWAMGDADGRVRSAAMGAIVGGATREYDVETMQLLRSALQDADVQVRSSALGALARGAHFTELGAALDQWSRAARDVDADARMATLRFIAAAWMRDSARIDATMRARLAAIPPSDEPLERAIVRSVTPMASWIARGEARAARPLGEYEEIARRYLTGAVTHAVLRTERGDIRVRLLGDAAPLTVDAIVRLARRGFYRDLRFHRVVPNFVAQDGDPRGDGTGSAGFFIRDEHSRYRHQRGCLGVATSGPETGGSQYYLCHAPQPHLDGGYTVFGQVVDGFDALDRIVQGDRIINIEIR